MTPSRVTTPKGRLPRARVPQMNQIGMHRQSTTLAQQQGNMGNKKKLNMANNTEMHRAVSPSPKVCSALILRLGRAHVSY